MKLNHILFSAAACMALGSAALTSCSEREFEIIF